MGNQLLNSMVRGFGMTLGRKAANAVTRPSESTSNKLSVKKEKYYSQLLGFKQEYLDHEKNAENLFSSNQITQIEYLSLKSQLAANLENINSELEKLDQLKNRQGSSFLKWVLIGFIVIPIIIGIFS
jgi:hypothetical protein